MLSWLFHLVAIRKGSFRAGCTSLQVSLERADSCKPERWFLCPCDSVCAQHSARVSGSGAVPTGFIAAIRGAAQRCHPCSCAAVPLCWDGVSSYSSQKKHSLKTLKISWRRSVQPPVGWREEINTDEKVLRAASRLHPSAASSWPFCLAAVPLDGQLRNQWQWRDWCGSQALAEVKAGCSPGNNPINLLDQWTLSHVRQRSNCSLPPVSVDGQEGSPGIVQLTSRVRLDAAASVRRPFISVTVSITIADQDFSLYFAAWTNARPVLWLSLREIDVALVVALWQVSNLLEFDISTPAGESCDSRLLITSPQPIMWALWSHTGHKHK